MFRLPDSPSSQAEEHELADFAEFLAWEKGSTSAREMLAALGRLDDNDYNIGCDDNSDETANELDEVMNEIERRRAACGGGYPFSLDLKGTVLRHEPDDSDARTHLYYYLLLGTRLNMQSNRVHAKIDGTHLLEELCAHALKNYLGATRAQSLVFGTAAKGGFSKKVDDLCSNLGEGGGFEVLEGESVDAVDDKLDVVAWVPFSDKKRCQLIVFGQCKTGSTWGNQVTQLQPDSFIKLWMKEPFDLDPVRAFCIAEAADRSRWRQKSTYAGLLLDRCRIIDFSENMDAGLLSRIKKWNRAAKSSVSLTKN